MTRVSLSLGCQGFQNFGLSLSLVCHDFVVPTVSLSQVCHCHYIITGSQRDTCSWKGQLEKTRSSEVLSWKVRHEFGKNEVGKSGVKLKNTIEVG